MRFARAAAPSAEELALDYTITPSHLFSIIGTQRLSIFFFHSLDSIGAYGEPFALFVFLFCHGIYIAPEKNKKNGFATESTSRLKKLKNMEKIKILKFGVGYFESNFSFPSTSIDGGLVVAIEKFSYNKR